MFTAEEIVAATETYRATKNLFAAFFKIAAVRISKKRADEILTKASCEFLGSLISYFFIGDPIQRYVACFLISEDKKCQKVM